MDIDVLVSAVMARRGEQVDEPEYLYNVRSACEEAMAHLRKIAGNPGLDFSDPDDRTLLIDCAWYILERQRAAFDIEYSGDLIMLRLREAHGCGKEESTDLS
ncbi:hypothetical protein MR626_13190 [bacterium]|nr:hypothetical protein [bacterium]